jgi:cytochrome c-type biogenesis protein CcmH/NrfG
MTRKEFHPQALKDIETAIQINPDSAQIWNNRGEILAKLGKVDEAVDSFDKAIGLSPNYTHAIFGKARTLLNAGRKPECKAVCQQFLAVAMLNDPRRARIEQAIKLCDQ